MTKYKLSPWSLADLFPTHDGPEIEAAFKEVETKAAKFEAFRERLTPNIDFEDFMDGVKEVEAITLVASRLGTYPSLWFAADTQSQRTAIPGKNPKPGSVLLALVERFG
jgi:oligoendopeptidase F